MANEINAFELTDEQLDMVAGGKGSSSTVSTTIAQALNETGTFNGNTNNNFTVQNAGNKGGAGGTAQQSGSQFSGIVFLGSESVG